MHMKIREPDARLTAILRDIGSGGSYFVKGDRTRGYHRRCHAENRQRYDRDLQCLPALARWGWIEFTAEPRDLHRYYPVRLTVRAVMFLSASGEADISLRARATATPSPARQTQ